MCKVNYITEHSSFMELAIKHELSANEIAFYNILLIYFNNLASGNDWPQSYVAIPNKRLLALLPFSEQTLIRTRESLLQRGLSIFEFVAGERKSEAPRYKLCYFSTAKERVQKDLNTSLISSTKETESVVIETDTYNIDIEKQEKKQSVAVREKTSKSDDTDTLDIALKNPERVQRIINIIEKHFEKKLLTSQRRAVGSWCNLYGFDDSVFEQAALASSGKNDPIVYMARVLYNWNKEGIPATTAKQGYIGKRVLHQAYEQRQYEEKDYNVWVPDFSIVESIPEKTPLLN